MARALMIGGVFLLARDPAALAEWYRRHLGWELRHLAAEDAHYIELYYTAPDEPEPRQHLVYAIMAGDPGGPGRGHIVNYRVDDLDAIVAGLHEEGVETSSVIVASDAEGEGKFVRFLDPEGHRVELWEHLADTAG
jgi:catechol 2,3-dioxygenase-like lactoylglutathione lyase family enzyme